MSLQKVCAIRLECVNVFSTQFTWTCSCGKNMKTQPWKTTKILGQVSQRLEGEWADQMGDAILCSSWFPFSLMLFKELAGSLFLFV